MAIEEVTLKASAGTTITRAWAVVNETAALTAETLLSGSNRTSVTSAVNTFTAGSDPWDRNVFGIFNDDPTWNDFPRWRQEQRHRI